MRLLSFDDKGRAAVGVRLGEEVVHLGRAAPELPDSILGLLQAGPAALDAARAAAEHARERLPLAGIRHLLPIPRPGKFIGIGLNYMKHTIEMGKEVPKFPGMYLRGPQSLLAHNEPILRPTASDQLDFEGELLIVIGKAGRLIKAADALDHVAGYSVFNDGTLRDFSGIPLAVDAGKNFDATGAVGPEIVTADELPPGAKGLRLTTRLNGDVMQDDNTANMYWDVAHAIEMMSEIMSLEPGDLLATGTPSGVGAGRTPQLWMKPGDRIEITLEGIGVLSNPIEDEPARRGR